MKTKLKKIFKVILKILIVGLILALGYLIFIKFYNGNQTTYSAVKGDYKEKINVKGTIDVVNSAKVFSKSSNKIKEICVKEGDEVKAGDVLAHLDDDKTHAYEKAEIDYKEAERNYENAKSLYETGDISQDNYIKAENAMNLAKVALDSLDIKDDLVVKADIDGVITKVDAKIGMIAGGLMPQRLFQIDDISKLKIKVDIKEKDLSKIKIGAVANIIADAMGDRVFHGKVTYISPVGEASVNDNTKKIINATISIDENEKNITAGVSAKADIIVKNYNDVLIIPIECLNEEVDTSYVYAIKGNMKKKIQVIPLVIADDEFIIKDDGTLSVDDKILGAK